MTLNSLFLSHREVWALVTRDVTDTPQYEKPRLFPPPSSTTAMVLSHLHGVGWRITTFHQTVCVNILIPALGGEGKRAYSSPLNVSCSEFEVAHIKFTHSLLVRIKLHTWVAARKAEKCLHFGWPCVWLKIRASINTQEGKTNVGDKCQFLGHSHVPFLSFGLQGVLLVIVS